MHLGDCQPLNCETAMNCIEGARDPASTVVQLGEYRSQLSSCAPCLRAFDMEIKLRTVMSPSMSELPSVDFRAKITQTLASVDLSQLDITDF